MNSMTWRLAKSLETLRSQINAAYPSRDKSSDGSVGDTAHAARPSDHNPLNGVVHAIDITNDPPHEVHCAIIAEAIRKSKDVRVKYLIFNYFMCASYDSRNGKAWTWRKYDGPNAHSHHLHISVNAVGADDTKLWAL